MTPLEAAQDTAANPDLVTEEEHIMARALLAIHEAREIYDKVAIDGFWTKSLDDYFAAIDAALEGK